MQLVEHPYAGVERPALLSSGAEQRRMLVRRKPAQSPQLSLQVAPPLVARRRLQSAVRLHGRELFLDGVEAGDERL